jgi:hypothetical protein
MKRYLLAYPLLIVLAVAQTSCTNKFERVNDYYLKYSLDHTWLEGPVAPEPLFYNETDKVLISQLCSVPLDQVTLAYSPRNGQDNTEHLVIFQCKGEKQCVLITQGESLNFGMALFGSKSECLEFIELLNDLRD